MGFKTDLHQLDRVKPVQEYAMHVTVAPSAEVAEAAVTITFFFSSLLLGTRFYLAGRHPSCVAGVLMDKPCVNKIERLRDSWGDRRQDRNLKEGQQYYLFSVVVLIRTPVMVITLISSVCYALTRSTAAQDPLVIPAE